jgi:hypothetical protein
MLEPTEIVLYSTCKPYSLILRTLHG